jgi:hypothetical protein
LIAWLTHRQSECDFDFDIDREIRRLISGNNKYLVNSHRWGSTPRLTAWLTRHQSECDFDFDRDIKELELGRDLEGRRSKVIEQGMKRRLHSD